MVKRVNKPWGYEEWYVVTPYYVGKVLFIRQGERLSLQYHERKTETLYILEGRARIMLNDNCTIELPGRVIHIEPLTKHRIEAIMDTTIIEVSTSEIDDVVRLEDDYGRVVISQQLAGVK